MNVLVAARTPTPTSRGGRGPFGVRRMLPVGCIVGALLSASAAGQDPYLAKDIDGTPGGSFPHALTPVGDRVFFAAWAAPYGWELWVSDGTESGTFLVRDLYRGPEGPSPDVELGRGSSRPADLTAAGGRLFFSAEDGERGRELWVSDGTQGGTVLVEDLVPGPEGSHPEEIAVARDRIFFSAKDPERGRELWVSDGTEAGTFLLEDIYPGPESSSPGSFAVLGGRVFFPAEDPEHGRELWVSDGTPNGTRLVRDLRPGAGGSDPRHLAAAGDRIFFAAADPEHGAELWASDGTDGGTALVRDIRPGPEGSWPSEISPAGDRVFFIATEAQHGSELWVSDGTGGGTRLVEDIFPGPVESECRVLGTTAGGRVFVEAFGYRAGPDALVWQDELWTSDGTDERTTRLHEFPAGSGPRFPLIVGEWIFFAARDDERGTELWVSNGTAAGTIVAADIVPGDGYDEHSSGPEEITAAGDRLFFTADVPGYGRELWVLPKLSEQAFPVFRVDPEGCQDGHTFFFDGSASFSGEAARIVSYRWRLWVSELFPREPEFEGPTLAYEPPEGTYALARAALTVRTDRGFERNSGEKTFCRAFPYRRGDANADGRIDISDPISILAYVFVGGQLNCLRAADADGTATLNPADAVGLLYHLFQGGRPPVPPYPDCGIDPSALGLGCLSYPACP